MMRTSSEKERLMEDGDNAGESSMANQHRRQSPWYRQTHSIVLLMALAISICIHIASLLPSIRVALPSQTKDQTEYAHLEWNVESAFNYHTIYNNGNQTEMDEAWENIDYDHGLIALDYDYAERKGLPKAQQFAWDDSKGTFFLNGYHSLHCLISIRKSLKQLHYGQPLSYEMGHIDHCFEALLQDIKCYADDLPRYMSEEHPGTPGFGQKRQCRDWNRLVEYSEEHYSCWRDLYPTNETYDTLLRYRFCPEGSPYREYVHAVFGDFDENEGLKKEGL